MKKLFNSFTTFKDGRNINSYTNLVIAYVCAKEPSTHNFKERWSIILVKALIKNLIENPTLVTDNEYMEMITSLTQAIDIKDFVPNYCVPNLHMGIHEMIQIKRSYKCTDDDLYMLFSKYTDSTLNRKIMVTLTNEAFEIIRKHNLEN